MNNTIQNRGWLARIVGMTETLTYLFAVFYWLSFSVARRRGIPIIDISSFTLQPSTIALTVMAVTAVSAFFSGRVSASLKSSPNKQERFLEILLPIALFAVAFATGGRFDYASYKLQWGIINEGLNPWGPVQGGMVNAYGPIHNLLAYPYAIWHLLPKIIFCSLILLVYQVFKRRWVKKINTQSLLMICYGPFIFSSIGVYGFMDIVPAALICIAAASFYGQSYGRTGLFLALATATKFYPALLVAPICVGLMSRNQARAWRSLILYFGLTLAIAFGGAWLIWGESVVTPMAFASERGPSFLTAWRLLPSGWAEHAKAIIITAIALLSAYAIFSRGKREINVGHLLLSAICFVFGLYYLGHQQFYVAIYLLLPVALMESAEGRIQNSSLSVFTSCLMLFWLTFSQISFDLFSEFKPPILLNLVDWMSVTNSLLLCCCGFLYASQSFSRIRLQNGNQLVQPGVDCVI